MTFQKGNQLWRLAKNAGQPRKYTPEELMEKANEYFEFCDQNKWMKYDVIKSGPDVGKVIEIPLTIPYTLEGLAVYLGLDFCFFRDNKKGHGEYSAVIKKIYEIIENHQLTGASVGVFNHQIIARKLGLADKQNISTPEGEEIRVNSVNEHRVIFENYDESNV